MNYEIVIGLEVHAQLLTESKMFCKCNARYADAEPNTLVCPICLGMPGVLPTMNQRALRFAVMTALALNCSIPEHSKFDRKNYMYPDLMKGYQISQYDMPLSRHGWLTIESGDELKRVGITRVHLEEDTAKLLHRTESTGETYSLVDVNRAGVPLLEIVGEPDLRSPEEARQYLVKLRSILRYLGVSTGDMEKGSFRCDANISVRPAGTTTFGKKVEIKNMNSFRAVARALEYEAQRQVEVVESGGGIVQETRGWVEDRGVTVGQRTKEYAHDYRYFPEPDLTPLVFSREWVEEIRRGLPELPDVKRDRFAAEYSLPPKVAALLTESRSTADFYEACVAAAGRDESRNVANWLVGEHRRLLDETGQDIAETRVTPAGVAGLIGLLRSNVVTGASAKVVFEEMFHTGKAPAAIVEEKGLVQIGERAAIAPVVEEVLAGNPQAVADYCGGKVAALNFLKGQVMRATRGKADQRLAEDLLREALTAHCQARAQSDE